MEERIQAAVDEALQSGPPVVSGPRAQWIKNPDKGWDKFPPLYGSVAFMVKQIVLLRELSRIRFFRLPTSSLLATRTPLARIPGA